MSWIIGDVHGSIKTLEALLKKLPKDDMIIFVGDLVDRGENSKEVIDLVRANGYDCVLGNHEESMIEDGEQIIEDSNLITKLRWTSEKYNYGGIDTLRSYKRCSDPMKAFKEDINWLKTLPLYKEYPNIKNKDGRYLVVTHSCIDDTWDKRASIDQFDKDDFFNKVLYSRNQNPKDNKEIFDIFGHTPNKQPIIKDHFANIDTGACYADRNLGKLTAIEFPSMKIIQQENIDSN
ncbi:MAG: metallophosphoesterase family protein [Campylobacterota bacterium]|nr:metallophosphoesterase family protein [Campylobacterota bacterium]